jgi:hypothetical protein
MVIVKANGEMILLSGAAQLQLAQLLQSSIIKIQQYEEDLILWSDEFISVELQRQWY